MDAMTESGLRCGIWAIKHNIAASSNLAPSEKKIKTSFPARQCRAGNQGPLARRSRAGAGSMI